MTTTTMTLWKCFRQDVHFNGLRLALHALLATLLSELTAHYAAAVGPIRFFRLPEDMDPGEMQVEVLEDDGYDVLSHLCPDTGDYVGVTPRMMSLSAAFQTALGVARDRYCYRSVLVFAVHDDGKRELVLIAERSGDAQLKFREPRPEELF